MCTLPPVGSCRPVMTLNSVVFPAPLGPIRPVIDPCSAVRVTSLKATTPPKRTVTSSASRSGNADLLGDGRGRRWSPSESRPELLGGLGQHTDHAVAIPRDGHRAQAGR